MRRQRGIAMLVAILLVALGTIIAAAVAYESAMSARRGSASLAFDEALLVGQGGEALAGYGLQQVLRNTKSSTGGGMPDVYPAEPWGQPVGPIEVVPGVTLEASLEDMQGRFNLNWLVDSTAQSGSPVNQNPLQGGSGNIGSGAGQKTPGVNQQAETVAAFNRLLEMLGIDTKYTDMIIDWIDSNQNPQPHGMEDSGYLSQNPPYLTANQYITSTTELLAIPGFTRDMYAKLAPYISALPVDQITAKLNICSARGVVLDAMRGATREFGQDEEAFEKNRAAAPGCFPTQKEYLAGADANTSSWVTGKIGTTSQYFRLSSLITIGTTEFNLYSLLYVDNQGYFAHPIQRSFTPD